VHCGHPDLGHDLAEHIWGTRLAAWLSKTHRVATRRRRAISAVLPSSRRFCAAGRRARLPGGSRRYSHYAKLPCCDLDAIGAAVHCDENGNTLSRKRTRSSSLPAASCSTCARPPSVHSKIRRTGTRPSWVATLGWSRSTSSAPAPIEQLLRPEVLLTTWQNWRRSGTGRAEEADHCFGIDVSSGCHLEQP
jgi:hypothetical protein